MCLTYPMKTFGLIYIPAFSNNDRHICEIALRDCSSLNPKIKPLKILLNYYKY